MSFDADTAITDGRATIPEHWLLTSGGPHGGFLAAVAARAAEEATGRPLRSLTVHYLAGPEAGPLGVSAVVEREGRSTSFASVRLEQHGRPVALALALLAPLREDAPAWSATAMPEAVPAADAPPLDESQSQPFRVNFDLREGLSPRPFTVGGWLRTAEPRALDGPLVAAMTDAWMPVAADVTRSPQLVPTLDLTVHVRSPLPPPGMAPEDHVLAVFNSTRGAGGVWEESGELWTPDGTLIAQSRQLALVR